MSGSEEDPRAYPARYADTIPAPPDRDDYQECVPCEQEADRFLCARAATRVAVHAGLAMDACVEMALVASELASNAARHGGGGWLLARVVPGGIQVICQDRGPGIDDPGTALVDGWSQGRRVTAEAPARGGLGTGLGTARRLSHALTFSRGGGLFTVVAFRFDEVPARLRRRA